MECPVALRGDSRGCALADAAVEITEPGHPARPVTEKYKADMRRRFRQLAREMGAREPNALGDSLMLLWEGAYVARVTMGAGVDRGVHRLI